VIFQHPNYFGCLEDARALCEIARAKGALAIASFDPISLGLLEQPAAYGADIVVAEGQPLGIPLQYGGPYLGVLACRQDFVRKMPGRLITEAQDREGRRCYVLGLQTREQHIRREKATSNICTNQGLLALRATFYLSVIGPHGLREVAELCVRKAHYAAEQLTAIDGIDLAFQQPFFKEFTLRCRDGAAPVAERARKAGFDIGPELGDCGDKALARDGLLVAVTEQRTREQIDALAAAVR
jgi:glycine dehydrogenase subunit 1